MTGLEPGRVLGLVTGGVGLYFPQAGRARRKTSTLQENRAKAVIAGEKASRAPRFVKTTGGDRVLGEG